MEGDLLDHYKREPEAFTYNRKLVRRLKRRVRARQAMIAEAERAFALEEFRRAHVAATQAIQVLAEAVFGQHALTFAAVKGQARNDLRLQLVDHGSV